MSSYTQLKTDIPSYMLDDSAEMAAMLDTFIDLAELRLSRDLLILAFDTTTTGTLANGTNTLARPSDIIQTNYIHWVNASGERVLLLKKAREWIFDYWPNASTTGAPAYYAELDTTQYIIAPTPGASENGQTYTIGYKQRLAALTSDNPTNWLTTNAYDALLYASCVEAATWKQDEELLQRFIGLYTQAASRVNNEFTRTLRDDLRPAPHVAVVNDGA